MDNKETEIKEEKKKVEKKPIKRRNAIYGV